MTDSFVQNSKFRSGFIGLLGYPNSGKSTFVNAFVGEKVAIVTSKPQTTRQRVTGIYTDNDLQVVFVDAPGVVHAKAGLNKFLQQEYESVVEDSDALLVFLNIDAKNPDSFKELIQLAQQSGKPWLGVITKTDLPHPQRTVILRDLVTAEGHLAVAVSSLRGLDEIMPDLKAWFRDVLPESSAPLYDPDLFTTQNVKDMAAELIREKCFEVLHQEIPFGSAVKIVKFDESDVKVIKIHGEIWISRESHKPIVVGKKASTIKKIGMAARSDLEKLLQRQVFLDLHVKVKKNWSKEEEAMKELGYVVPE